MPKLNLKTWKTIVLIGWAVMPFGALGMFLGLYGTDRPSAGNVFSFYLVIFLLGPIIIFAGKLGSIWSSKSD